MIFKSKLFNDPSIVLKLALKLPTDKIFVFGLYDRLAFSNIFLPFGEVSSVNNNLCVSFVELFLIKLPNLPVLKYIVYTPFVILPSILIVDVEGL